MSADAVVTAFMTSLFFLLGLSETRAEKLPPNTAAHGGHGLLFDHLGHGAEPHHCGIFQINKALSKDRAFC